MPTVAHSASLRIVGVVPVSCSAEIISGSVTDRQLTISVRRACNTWHEVVLRGAHDDALGDVEFRYNGRPAMAGSGDGVVIEQPDRFYEGVDQLTVSFSSGSAEDLARYAASLRIELQTT
jgi:hypothetical protein